MAISSVWGTMVPLFLVLLLGVVIRLTHILDWQTCRNLSSFIVNVAEPLLIVASFQTKIDGSSLRVAVFIALIALIMHIAYTLVSMLIYRGEGRASKSTLEFGLIFGNITYLGYPLLLVPFPKSGPFYFAVFALVSNIYAQTVGKYLLNSGAKSKKALLKSIINPGTVAALVGIGLRLLPFDVPAVFTDTMMTVGNLCFPLAMLIVGSLICNQPFKKLFSPKLYMFSLFRLIVLPLLTLGVCLLFAGVADEGMCYLVMIMACVPTAASAAIYSDLYKGNSPLAASCVGISSLLSVITVPFMLWLTKLLFEVFYG